MFSLFFISMLCAGAKSTDSEGIIPDFAGRRCIPIKYDTIAYPANIQQNTANKKLFEKFFVNERQNGTCVELIHTAKIQSAQAHQDGQ